MQEALLEMPNEVCASFEVGALGALFEPSMTRETKLISYEESLIGKLVSVLDRQLLAGLECRTATEFKLVRKKVWPKYIRALRALSDTMSNLESADEIALRGDEALLSISQDLEKQRGARFRDKLVDQAVFTLWTLGKIRSLAREICLAGKSRDPRADNALISNYHAHSLWAQFHMDCVVAAMKFRRDIPAEIQETLCDGLRALVNAYVIMREGLALRTNDTNVVPPANLPWDEEDERLLASSMRDMHAISDASDC